MKRCLFLFSIALGCVRAVPPELRFEQPSTNSATLRLFLGDPAASLAALQVDFHHNAALLLIPKASDAVRAAAKIVRTQQVEPGVTRVLITGINDRAIEEGPVLDLEVHPQSGTTGGTYPIRMVALTGCDGEGYPVEVTTSSGEIPVDAGSPASNIAVLPFIVSGLGWETGLALANPSDQVASAHLKFWDLSGAPLALRFSDATLAATRDLTIPPRALVRLATESTAESALVAGWAQIEGPPEVLLPSASLTLSRADWLALETPVPPQTSPASGYEVALTETGSQYLGLALTNPSPDLNLTVILRARNDQGDEIVSDQLVLPPRHQVSFALVDRYPMLNDVVGVLEVRCEDNAALVLLALQFYTDGSFTTVRAKEHRQ